MDKLQKFGRFSKRAFDRLITHDDDEVVSDYNFITHINEEKMRVSWCIENISRCCLNTGEYHESPPFSIGFSGEVKWSLRIYTKGRKVSGKVGLFIHKISDNPKTSLKYRLHAKLIPESTKNSEEKSEFSYDNATKTLKTKDDNVESREWGTDEFFPSEYLNLKKSLRITCRLSVVYMDDGGNESYTAGPPRICTLYNGLKEIYKSGKFSDLTLQVGKKKFPAHKIILAARSKVFAAMFDHDMKENQTSVITIDDVEPSVMSSVLRYIYTGEIEDLTMEKAVNLFPVADKYSLEELQKRCIGVMLTKLSTENVCQIAILADMHSVPQLKTATYYLIRKYKHEILKKKEWQKIIREKPHLASDILQAVSSDFTTNC